MRRDMTSRLIAFGVIGLASGIGAFWVAAHALYQRAQVPTPPVTLLVGWSLIGSGLLSWRARPDNRLGPVMVVTGFAWFASILQEGNNDVLFTIGLAVQLLYLAGFLYVILSFPSGRLPTALDRALVVAASGLVTVGQLAWLLFAGTRSVICERCPANLLAAFPDDALARWLEQFQRIAGLVVTVAALALVAVRLARASRPQRRAMMPVLLAGIVGMAALAASILSDALGAASSGFLGRVSGYAFAVLPVAVLVAFLQRRLARGVVAGLVVKLGEPGASVGLAEALARALQDPSLALGYWLPAESRYVDIVGRPVSLPAPGSGRMHTVVERDGQPVAVLLHDPALEDNAELVDSVCAAAGLTLENERLQAELRAKLAELQQSRARLVEATEEERRRIERDLHDGAQQRLVSIAMSLGLLESKLPADPAAAKPIAQTARQALAAALNELRELSQGILPGVLAERGLPAALEELCARTVLPTRLKVAVDRRLPAQVETAAYFLVSEALTNAAKYAQASEAQVGAHDAGGLLTVEVADDGVGGAVAGRGSGLRGMADRVEALGGTFTLSSPDGEGTVVHAELPCG